MNLLRYTSTIYCIYAVGLLVPIFCQACTEHKIITYSVCPHRNTLFHLQFCIWWDTTERNLSPHKSWRVWDSMHFKTCRQNAEIKLSKVLTHNFDALFSKPAKREMEQSISKATSSLFHKKINTDKWVSFHLIKCSSIFWNNCNL